MSTIDVSLKSVRKDTATMLWSTIFPLICRMERSLVYSDHTIAGRLPLCEWSSGLFSSTAGHIYSAG